MSPWASCYWAQLLLVLLLLRVKVSSRREALLVLAVLDAGMLERLHVGLRRIVVGRHGKGRSGMLRRTSLLKFLLLLLEHGDILLLLVLEAEGRLFLLQCELLSLAESMGLL